MGTHVATYLIYVPPPPSAHSTHTMLIFFPFQVVICYRHVYVLYSLHDSTHVHVYIFCFLWFHLWFCPIYVMSKCKSLSVSVSVPYDILYQNLTTLYILVTYM